MPRISTFKNLDVYIVAKQIVKGVYSLVKKFPAEERYALCDQIRRAVVSVPSNIAEGLGRVSSKEQVHFLEIAYGSLMEVDAQLDIATDLGYITAEAFDNMEDIIDKEARLLSGMRSRKMNNGNRI